MSFGENLRNVRKKKNITQEDLAETLGVSRQAISKWESNNGYPETEKLLVISEVLNISIDSLLNGSSTLDVKQEIAEAESVKASNKLYIIDANKRKLAAFEEFGIDMIGINNTGEADVITGFKKENTKVKVPVCTLYGITKGILGRNKRTTLGYYSTLENAQKELTSISKASKTDTQYELKYAAKMQGVRIVEDIE